MLALKTLKAIAALKPKDLNAKTEQILRFMPFENSCREFNTSAKVLKSGYAPFCTVLQFSSETMRFMLHFVRSYSTAQKQSDLCSILYVPTVQCTAQRQSDLCSILYGPTVQLGEC